METITTRIATNEDVEAVNDISNHYIANGHTFFDLEPTTIEQRKEWFNKFQPTGRYRLIVACNSDGNVVGYCCSAPWRDKVGYDVSVETTVCISPEYTGKGIGRKLYDALFKSLIGEDIHRIYAGIVIPNEASFKLHETYGFQQVGYFTELGRMRGRYWDVAWLEKRV